MQVTYIYFWLKDISGFENFLSKIRGLIKLNKKTMSNVFFQFLMLNISSIKELLHKSSEIQWNITETLPRKLKRKISWALSYKILPPEITKMWEMSILGGGGGYFGTNVGLGTNVEPTGFFWFCEFLKVSASIFWLKTVLTLK